jgi:hypothetical protein
MYGNFELIVEGKELTYVLSALFEPKTKSYHMPSFIAYRDYGMTYEKDIFYWDNDSYLHDTFYKKVIMPWYLNQKIVDPEEFAEFIDNEGVSIKDIGLIAEMFQKADELGLFYEHQKSS